MKSWSWTALLLTSLCWGCGSSPNTAFYALAAARGTVRQVALGTIEIRRPAIAGYLDRTEILAPWDGQRLQLAQSTGWGEPITAMIGRVLAEDLGDRLQGTIVFSAASELSLQPSAVIELAIRKFDLDPDGSVRLKALVVVRWQRTDAAPVTRAVELRAQPTAADTGGVVAAMSSLLGQLADEIATDLVAHDGRDS